MQTNPPPGPSMTSYVGFIRPGTLSKVEKVADHVRVVGIERIKAFREINDPPQSFCRTKYGIGRTQNLPCISYTGIEKTFWN